jgi:putative ABC transport system permease protein
VTAGRTAATEAQVLASIDDAGTRLITVIDTTGGAAIHPDSVAAVAELPGVAWAIGLGPASDAVIEAPGTITGHVSTRVPVRELVGHLPAGDAPLSAGRLPQRPGEAVASRNAATRLGLLDGAGPVTTPARHTGVVGVVAFTGALAPFADAVLIQASPVDAADLRFIYLVAENTSDVPAIAVLVEAAVRAENPAQIAIETPEGIIALQRVISGQLGASSRQLMAGILGVGVALVGVTTFGMVSAKRRDFGRRRALGASRSAIVVLVLVQAFIAALVGVALGTTVGVIAVHATVGNLPTTHYIIGLALLTVMAALTGTIPPAVLASRRDPVRILRVP